MSDFEVLHLVRIRGMARLESLDDTHRLISESLLISTKHGYLLSPQGLEHHDFLVSRWRKTVDLGMLAKAYERFLAVNTLAKQACASWQQTSRDDLARLVAVDTLTEVTGRAGPGLRRAGNAVPRFNTYIDRLGAALEFAGMGDGRFLTDPGVDSFHNVWFECHEDFLVTLGRSREDEGSH